MNKKKKRIILIIVIVVAALVIGCIAFFVSKMSKINYEETDMSKVSVNAEVLESEPKETGLETIALFGLDNRDQESEEKGRTDVIMLLVVNHDTQEMRIVSVYRDTILNIGDDSYQKCNAAYAYGGKEQAISMLNTNLDLDIDHYVTFNFEAVADAVDALGGIDIEVEEAELDPLNSNIEHNNQVLGTSSPKIESAGTIHMDGTQAVAYGRIRYTEGGDFRRTERQRTVLTKMVEELKTASASKVNEVTNIIFPEITTDFTSQDLMTLAKSILSYEASDFGGFPFEKTTMTMESKGSIVVPCELDDNVQKLHMKLYGEADYDTSDVVDAYSDEIVDITGKTDEDVMK